MMAITYLSVLWRDLQRDPLERITGPSPSWITVLSWHGLCNSVKLRALTGRASQDRWVIVKNSDKTWFARGGNGYPL